MQKKGITAFILWLLCLIGICGIQRFYLNRPLTGVLWLCTFGFLGLAQLYDLLFLGSLVRETNMLNAQARNRTGNTDTVTPNFSIRLNVQHQASAASEASRID